METKDKMKILQKLAVSSETSGEENETPDNDEIPTQNKVT